MSGRDRGGGLLKDCLLFGALTALFVVTLVAAFFLWFPLLEYAFGWS